MHSMIKYFKRSVNKFCPAFNVILSKFLLYRYLKSSKKSEKKVLLVTHFKTLRLYPCNTEFTPIYVGLHLYY